VNKISDMDIMFNALEKFIKLFGIKYDIHYVKSDYDYLGRKYVCLETEAYFNDKIIYDVFDCFIIFDDGRIKYMESNINVDIDKGTFAHFADKKVVEDYFMKKVIEKVKLLYT
jgi:hypothetical protein